MKSLFFTLNKQDYLKGLIVAVISAVITVIYSTIQTGTLTLDWKAIATAALSAALAYITKNLLTNSEDKFLAKDPA
jgi:hypothetical protein